MYILQDAAKPQRLPFQVIVPIKTVYSLLEEKDSLHLITDKRAVDLVSLPLSSLPPLSSPSPLHESV